MTIKERMFEEDGRLIVSRSENVDALIRQNKIEAETTPSYVGHAAMRKVGSIPATIAEQWSRECRAGIGTKEFAAYAKKKLMDGEFAAFRVKGA